MSPVSGFRRRLTSALLDHGSAVQPEMRRQRFRIQKNCGFNLFQRRTTKAGQWPRPAGVISYALGQVRGTAASARVRESRPGWAHAPLRMH